jgi:hypothetical protein
MILSSIRSQNPPRLHAPKCWICNEETDAPYKSEYSVVLEERVRFCTIYCFKNYKEAVEAHRKEFEVFQGQLKFVKTE